jgi:uncharacterized membrane protein
MSSSRIRRAAIGAALCATVPALWALPTQYHLQDLGAGSQAVHINAGGVAAGTDTSAGRHAPATWVDGQVQWLIDPYPEGDAAWINDAGVVVGTVEAGYSSAAYWTSYGVFADIGSALGMPGSYITSINGKGDCVIFGATDAETTISYLAPHCNISKRLPIGYYLRGVAINAADQVALTDLSHASQQRAYLYSDGTYTDVGVLAGYTQSVAADLNGDAHVVGTSADAAYDLREGFFWNGTRMSKVGTLGGQRSEAKAVNNRDIVVGAAQTRTGTWHAFVRDMHAAGARPQDLATMLDASGAGWTLDSAVSINRSGQILVHGTAPGDPSPRSAILTPLD